MSSPELDLYGRYPYNLNWAMNAMSTSVRTRRKAKAQPDKTLRFDARLTKEQKALLQRAADLEGRTMTDFVLHVAQVAARRTIEELSMAILTVQETEAFVDAVLHPADPGPVLRMALRTYRAATRARKR